jgi:hypothetical protein
VSGSHDRTLKVWDLHSRACKWLSFLGLIWLVDSKWKIGGFCMAPTLPFWAA